MHGWTPDQIAEMTWGQITPYLSANGGSRIVQCNSVEEAEALRATIAASRKGTT